MSNVSPMSRGGAGTPIDTDADPDTAMDNPEVRDAIASSFARIRQLEDDRATVNADIRAVYEGLKARGLSMDAIRDAYRYYKRDDQGKSLFNRTLLIARKAIDDPIQPDLLEDSPDSSSAH